MAFLETCQFDFTLERIKSRILPQPEERTPLLTDIPEEGDDEGTQIFNVRTSSKCNLYKYNDGFLVLLASPFIDSRTFISRVVDRGFLLKRILRNLKCHVDILEYLKFSI